MRRYQALLLGLLGCTSLEPGTDFFAADGGAMDASSDSNVPDAGPRCPSDVSMRETVDVEAVVDGDTTWTCERNYRLVGNVVVTSGTLTIEAGTRVYAADEALLLVTKDARLVAEGRADAPIVFSPAETEARRHGQWRGVVLLGDAPTVFSPTTSRVFGTVPQTDPRGAFGGPDENDDCGTLRYVRIEFAGDRREASNSYTQPAAGLTFAGCGRGTEVDHVQVHRSSDGIGLFGGLFAMSEVVVSAPAADGIEWVGGFRGLIQFGIVQTFAGSSAALKGSREESSPTGDPESEPSLYNLTLVGAPGAGANGFETGVRLQAGTLGWVRNALVQGFLGSWVDVVEPETAERLTSTTRVGVAQSAFADRLGAGFPTTTEAEEDGGFDEDTHFRSASFGNRELATAPLRSPYDAMAPDFSAGFGAVTNPASVPGPTGFPTYRPVDFYGAMNGFADDDANRRAVDWTLGWTAYPTQ
ncbi:MAG: hypothetical protein H6721_16215 [Sandaracinus sp.]|nr:hypothetical protein [Sandaracinus sp.]MCB9633663.1 hypothetical protein [Sandaracinus sp.]